MSRKLDGRRYEEIGTAVADLIEDYGISYPVDLFALAETLGVRVITHRGGLPRGRAAARTEDGYTNVNNSANGPQFQIHLDQRKPTARRRFTLAHELGHIWLGHFTESAPASEEEREGEAHHFASNLLAPTPLICAWVPQLTVDGIARTFRLSEEAASLAHRRALRALNLQHPQGEYYGRIAASAVRAESEPDGGSSETRRSA
ncbi:MAG: ImmA/IrrE family metallo-endopeptidase [Bifidobacteriaceae bacterium]|jgi:Zn-dependent peptidase ImmA (M78 family)|nr:ImmA/IrrE family metallo-endopeptidase [Bifidobacteriaceae bacterium]